MVCLWVYVCCECPKQKGGDKLTLNLTGSSNLTKNTNAGQSNLASPLSKVFPSPPSSAGIKSDTPTLLSFDTIQDTDNRPNLVNGVTANSNDTVTVTHFSEKRGTIEKISVPSVNIFNAEFKAESSKSTTKSTTTTTTTSSTNPFLNASSVAVMPTHTTNPFHISLTTNPIELDTMPLQTNEYTDICNDVNSICSDNNNDETITNTATPLISKVDPIKLITTNPFTVAIDEIDNDCNHTEKFKINNSDTLKNLKNNNNMINEKTEPSLDEKNKNKKYIEVNFACHSIQFFFFCFFLEWSLLHFILILYIYSI